MMQNKVTKPLVCIVLVNYNGWTDTLECLESLLKIDYDNYNIVVVDNASSDNSIHFIKAWAVGEIEYISSKSKFANTLVFPPVVKPVSFSVHEPNSSFTKSLVKKEIVLVKSDINLGFAGGNNLGTKLFMSLPDQPSFYWYLNNDTVVEKNALSTLINSYQNYLEKGKKLGILGSKLRYYHKPDVLQAIGAIYNPWFGTVKHIGVNKLDEGQYDSEPDKIAIDYIVGASMLVSKSFINETGLMEEDYFLYFEELDWVQRGKRKNFTIAYCPGSIVYHKEGASIGTDAEKKIKSKLSDYYVLKNRIKITKRYYKYYLPSVYLVMVISIINRVKRRQINRIPMIIKLLFSS